jgi:drug/metabolite transporter (DMT)-like permease
MIAGLLLAMLASLGSGIGSAVEAFGVRRAASRGEKPGDVGQLLREPLYLGGLTIDLLGFVFTVLALQLLPLFLVQAVVASSVGITAIVVAISGRPLGRAGWFALAASLAGLVLLAMSAPVHDVPVPPSPWHWALLGMALPIGAIGLLAVRSTSRWSAAVLAFAAGLAFSCIAVAARSLEMPDPAWSLVTEPGVWAIVVNGILGTALFAMALQRGRVTVVAGVTFTTETVLPAIVGLTVLGDRVREGYAVVAAAGFLIAVGGAIALARFTEPTSANAPAPLRADPTTA